MKFIYTSDRGDKYEVSKMQTSHLINVIGHHRTQIETLRYLDLHDHAAILENVIDLLADELSTREMYDQDYLEILEIHDD